MWVPEGWPLCWALSSELAQLSLYSPDVGPRGVCFCRAGWRSRKILEHEHDTLSSRHPGTSGGCLLVTSQHPAGLLPRHKG